MLTGVSLVTNLSIAPVCSSSTPILLGCFAFKWL